jgi:hypothetical protein
MTDQRAYWVQWRGFIRDQNGDKVDPAADGLRAFLSIVTAEFTRHDSLIHPAVVSHGGVLYLTSSVEAPNEGDAVNKAKQAFDECIKLSGGVCDFPDGDHPSWTAHDLDGATYKLERTTIEVRDLASV